VKITESRNKREGHFAGKHPYRYGRSHRERFQLRYACYRADWAADEAHDWECYWWSL